MSLLDQQGVFLPYLHLLGGPFGEPPRYSFEERVAAAATDGVTGIGFDGDEFDTLLKTHTVDQLRGILADHGVTIGELQILYGWHFGGDYGRMARQMEDHLYDLADQFDIKQVKTVIMTPTEFPPQEVLVERFNGILDRAADHGIRIALEPQSVNPGFDYAAAVDLILASGRKNAGFVVDGWHFFRDPDPYTALEKLPAEHIFGVELRDATTEPQISRMEDCLNYNLLPGEGDFDLVTLLRTLDAKGVDTPIAAEIMSNDLRKLSAQENIDRTIAAVEKVMAAARAA